MPLRNTSYSAQTQRIKTTVSGFTLIEIIVVVAIIGTMVAFLGVSMSRDSDRMAALEAKRFHAVVNEVRDEAILTGEAFRLTVNVKANNYSFEGVRSGRNLQADDGLLKLRSLEPGVALEWEVFDDFLQEEEPDEEETGEVNQQYQKKKPPSVLITPLGEITPFDASFSGDETTHFVFIDEQNQLARRTKENGAF